MRATACKSGTSHPVKHLLGVLLPFFMAPSVNAADIYRCEAKGETYFSQIPCNDQAQAVVIEDRQMFSTPANVSTLPPSARVTQEPAATRTPADNLKEFVETLNRQRSEELAKADRQITDLEAQLANAEGQPANDPELVAVGEQLAEARTARDSISGQYDSMIIEAERRLAEMVTSNKAVAKSGGGDG